MIKLILLLCLCFATCIFAGQINYVDCGSTYSLKNVSLEGCEIDTCSVEVGKNLTFSFDLDTTNGAKSLTAKASLYVSSLHIELNLYPDSPCDILKCPFTFLNDSYTVAFYIDPNYHYLSTRQGNIHFIITDELNNWAVCMRVYVTIV